MKESLSTMSPPSRDEFLRFLAGNIAKQAPAARAYTIGRLGKSFVKELGRRQGKAVRKKLQRMVAGLDRQAAGTVDS